MISNASRNFLNARGVFYLKTVPHSKTLQVEAKSIETNFLVPDDQLMLPSYFFRKPEFINNPTTLHPPEHSSPEFSNLIGGNPFYLLPIDYHIPSPKHFLLVIPDLLEKESLQATIELKNSIELCFPLLGTSFSLHKNHLALKKRAEIDIMTGAYNRASIEEMLSNEITKTKLQGNNLSILMIDLDHFKKINDKFGHLAGDEVLIELTKNVSKVLRSEDRIGRYGGEEFLVILPGATTKTAQVIAERILSRVEELRFIKYPLIRLTVSIGIASYPEHAPHLTGLLSLADQMLYNSKYSGRNRASTPKEHIEPSEEGDCLKVTQPPSLNA
jgi:diguanylate cyclase (GGDEF)-like protein